MLGRDVRLGGLFELYRSGLFELSLGHTIRLFILLLDGIEMQVILELQPFPTAVLRPPRTRQARRLRRMPIHLGLPPCSIEGFSNPHERASAILLEFGVSEAGQGGLLEQRKEICQGFRGFICHLFKITKYCTFIQNRKADREE